MFSVFINERRKKKTVKGPQKPMAVLLPTSHRKESTRKKAEEGKRNQESSQVGMGQLPLCSVLRGSRIT